MLLYFTIQHYNHFTIEHLQGTKIKTDHGSTHTYAHHYVHFVAAIYLYIYIYKYIFLLSTTRTSSYNKTIVMACLLLDSKSGAASASHDLFRPVSRTYFKKRESSIDATW